jgi:hypothetical protein
MRMQAKTCRALHWESLGSVRVGVEKRRHGPMNYVHRVVVTLLVVRGGSRAPHLKQNAKSRGWSLCVLVLQNSCTMHYTRRTILFLFQWYIMYLLIPKSWPCSFMVCLFWVQSMMSRRRHRPLDFLDHTATKNYSGVHLAPLNSHPNTIKTVVVSFHPLCTSNQTHYLALHQI